MHGQLSLVLLSVRWMLTVKQMKLPRRPELLSLLDIRGCTVTMDAMGCQTEIARQIINGGAHNRTQCRGR